jgi:type III secretion protein S
MSSVGEVVQLAQQALLISLYLSLPAVAAAGIVGLLVGLIQALTQLQDQALLIALKLGAVISVLALTGNWMGSTLTNFFEQLLAAAF